MPYSNHTDGVCGVARRTGGPVVRGPLVCCRGAGLAACCGIAAPHWQARTGTYLTGSRSSLVAAGKLERVSRGVYTLPGRRLSEHRSLAEACLRVPQGVVCLLSALRVHGIGTQAPFEVWIAIPQNAPTPRVDQPALRVVRMSRQALADGVGLRRIDGVDVQIFNAERTVADCFKFRNKVGLDVALEALRDGWSRRLLSMDALVRHAATDRVGAVMRPYLESAAR